MYNTYINICQSPYLHTYIRTHTYIYIRGVCTSVSQSVSILTLNTHITSMNYLSSDLLN